MTFRALSLFVRDDVAALYVDARGPYPKLVRTWFDAEDDARAYSGPLPVVVHPPCGPWGRLRHLSKKDDPSLAPAAVEQVRRWGGVLEHPAHSLLWKACGLPKPGEPPDAWGGVSLRVDQVDFGHVARKPTWIYFVGGTPAPLPSKRDPTHWIGGFRESGGKVKPNRKPTGSAVPPGIKVCSAQQRRRTPLAFATWLIDLAASARRPSEGAQIVEGAAEPVAVAVAVDSGDAP